MWYTGWHSSAHAHLKMRYPRYLTFSALLALALAGLGAAFAPPYIPVPFELTRPIIVEPAVLPEVVIPKEPKPIQAPVAPLPLDFMIDRFANRNATIGLQIENPFALVTQAATIAPSQAVPIADRSPVPIHTAAPIYPTLAMQIGAEGQVIVKATIDERGRVIVATVSWSNTIELLEQAALEAARQFLFQPAMQGSVPVICHVEIPFNFELD